MGAFTTIEIDPPDEWQRLPYHPLALVCDFGSNIDLEGMVSSFKKFGYDVHEPIILFKGVGGYQVVDGRHRHYSAIQALVTPTFRLYTGDNLKAFIMKKLFRQTPTKQARAILADLMASPKPPPETPEAETKHDERATKRAKKTEATHEAEVANDPAPQDTLSGAAASLNISRESADRARRVRENGTQQLYWLLSRSKIAIALAADIAALPKEEQKTRLTPYFCERCLRTGATQADCAACDEVRRTKPTKAPPPPAKPVVILNGSPRFEIDQFRQHCAKAIAEANKYARELGYVTSGGAINEPEYLTKARLYLEDAIEQVKEWIKWETRKK